MQPEQGIDINDPTLVRTMPGFGSGSSSRVGDECGNGSNHLSNVGELLPMSQEDMRAAVGWCAPSETVFDGELADSADANWTSWEDVKDLSEIVASLPPAQMVRGGIVHRDLAPVVDRNGFRTETGF